MNYGNSFSISNDSIPGPGNSLGLSFEGMSAGGDRSDTHAPLFPQQSGYLGFGMSQHAYMQDTSQVRALMERLSTVERQLLQVMTERDTIKSLFDQLSEAVKTDKPGTKGEIVYRDNGKIRFWTLDSFKGYISSAEGLAKMEGQASVTFLEDEDSNTLDPKAIRALRKDLKVAFRELATKGMAPKTWGKVSATAKDIVKDYMDRNWPIFRLAEKGWKLDHLASLDYSGWIRTNLSKDGKLLSAPAGEEEFEPGPSRKRKGKAKVEQGDKKLKFDTPDTSSESFDNLRESEELYRMSPEPSTSPDLNPMSPCASPPPLSSTPSSQFSSGSSGIASGVPSSLALSDPLVSLPVISAAFVPSNERTIAAPASSQQHIQEVPNAVPTPSTEPTVALPNSDTAPHVIPSAAEPAATRSAGYTPDPVQQAESDSGAVQASPSVDSPAVPVVVDPLGMLAMASLKIKIPILPPPATASASKTSNEKQGKSKRKMRPPKSHTGYALCSWRWLTQVNTKGTSEEFQVYWKTDLNDAQREAYNTEAKELDANNTWNKDIYHGKLY